MTNPWLCELDAVGLAEQGPGFAVAGVGVGAAAFLGAEEETGLAEDVG